MIKFIFIVFLVTMSGLFGLTGLLDGDTWRGLFFLVTMRWLAVEFLWPFFYDDLVWRTE